MLVTQALTQHEGILCADGDDQAQGVTLNVATNADSLGTWFITAAAAFGRETGDLLNIAIDDEEHTVDWLRRGRVLAAVTALAKPVTGCQVRALGSLVYAATASPDYMAQHFRAEVTAEAIANAPGLVFDQKDRLQHLWIRQTFGRAVTYPSHWLPSTQSFVDASLAGLGWALNPNPLVRDHLAAGRLVELLPGAVLERPLFWQVNRLAADQLSALTKHIVSASGHSLRR
jgi:LysR family transcriptional regulator (chromosome initiation inhibitor)